MEIRLPKNNIYSEVIEELAKAIKGSKWENSVYLCGGGVRDLLLGRDLHDIDLVVTTENGGIDFAEWICKEYGCFTASNPIIFPTYGTAKFNLRTINKFNNVNIECVETRKEKYDGVTRNPQCEYGTLMEDCLRRDLTINALYMDICNKKVIDPSKMGLNDLKECILRTPCDPTETFKDDALRMLRVLRFKAQLGWGIEARTWVGIVKNVHGIKKISQERITEEVNKMLLTEKPSIAFYDMFHCGLLKYIIPEIYNMIGCEQGKQHFGDVFSHTMSVIDKTQCILPHRLGGLFHDIAKPDTKCTVNGKVHFFGHEYRGTTIATDIMKRMKYANNMIDLVCLSIKNHMRFKQSSDKCPSDKTLRKFMMDMENSNNMAMVLDVINADNASHADGYCMINQVNKIINRIIELKDAEKEVKFVLPINGHDIMEHFGLKKGPRIGELLDVAKDAYLENPNITKEECFKEIEKVMFVDIF